MRIITFNANGIRAASRKGFFEWFKQIKPDFLCIQETKAHQKQLSDAIFYPQGYECYFCDAEKKGYSGVAIYTRHTPCHVIKQTDIDWVNKEGRYLELIFNNLRVVSVYFPSGASGDHRQQKKWDFLNAYRQMLLRQIKSHQPSVVCGDVNIVHKAIDIKNFKSNQKTSGCLPEERAWLDRVFEDIGWVDGFRVINQNPDEYTWWSYRGQARAKNVGWRIDYQMVTPYLASLINDGFVYRKQHFSDHAPVVIDYDFTPQTGQNK